MSARSAQPDPARRPAQARRHPHPRRRRPAVVLRLRLRRSRPTACSPYMNDSDRDGVHAPARRLPLPAALRRPRLLRLTERHAAVPEPLAAPAAHDQHRRQGRRHDALLLRRRRRRRGATARIGWDAQRRRARPVTEDAPLPPQASTAPQPEPPARRLAAPPRRWRAPAPARASLRRLPRRRAAAPTSPRCAASSCAAARRSSIASSRTPARAAPTR